MTLKNFITKQFLRISACQSCVSQLVKTEPFTENGFEDFIVVRIKKLQICVQNKLLQKMASSFAITQQTNIKHSLQDK